MRLRAPHPNRIAVKTHELAPRPGRLSNGEGAVAHPNRKEGWIWVPEPYVPYNPQSPGRYRNGAFGPGVGLPPGSQPGGQADTPRVYV